MKSQLARCSLRNGSVHCGSKFEPRDEPNTLISGQKTETGSEQRNTVRQKIRCKNADIDREYPKSILKGTNTELFEVRPVTLLYHSAFVKLSSIKNKQTVVSSYISTVGQYKKLCFNSSWPNYLSPLKQTSTLPGHIKYY